jgi:hypothetical protein
MTTDAMPPRIDRCRSCSAEIIWLVMRPGGRRMPIDAEPARDGNVLADLNAAAGIVLSAASRAEVLDATPDEPLYRSHFSTCPQADRWRRR